MGTVDNNKLVALFMGGEDDAKYVDGSPTINFPNRPHGRDGVRYPYEDLKYSSDWNWLMKVVEKIESLNYEVFIEPFEIRIEKSEAILFRQHTKIANQSKIEAVYNTCVEFIEWFNGGCEVLYARKCSATKEGMNEGYCYRDGERYFKYKSDLLDFLRSNTDNQEEFTDDFILTESYNLEEYYWTVWEDIEDYEWVLANGVLTEIDK